MVPLYRYFARDWVDCLDFSEDALYDMYFHESQGLGHPKPDNGFHHGKKWLSVAVAQWLEDLWVTVFPWELYEDENLPDWWLDRQFPLWCKAWREAGMIPQYEGS